MGAAPISLWLPFAVHISDGVLRAPWLAAGFVVSGLLVLLAAYRVRDEEIPRIALLSAAFFVATLMHLPLGPTRVHLLLNGLVGVVLGRRAPLAIAMGLALQAVLLGHGGLATIGVNACVMTLPALLAAALFAGLRRLPWFGRSPGTLTWLCGCVLGMVSVLATLILDSMVLLWGGAEDWHQIVWIVFYAHLPIVVLEGVVVGFTVNFLVRVKPEMIGLKAAVMNLEDSTHPTISPPLVLMLAALSLLFLTKTAHAHNACADFLLLPDRHVQIDGWYDPGAAPMRGAKVQVFRPGQRLFVEGRLDDNGSFVFRFTDAEPLEVIVNGGAGHRASFVIPREKLEANAQDEPRPLGSGADNPSPTVAAQKREHPDSWRERLKDALLGINFLLSLGAFLLSWRTSRRMRRSENEA